MKFSMLLYSFYLLLRYTARRSPEFKKKLKERDMAIQIKTSEPGPARYYKLNNGSITSGKGIDNSSDFSLVWSDASSGFKYMAKASPKALMKAMAENNLKLEGDAASLTWFLELMKKLSKQYKK